MFELNDSTNTITDSNSTVYLFMMHQEQTCLCYIPVNYYFFLIWDRLFFWLPESTKQIWIIILLL